MKVAPVRIVPSVLPANLARLGDEVIALEKAGADRIQWDVMDGHFVPNLTFGPDVVGAARRVVEIPFEAHLMVTEPDALLPRWVEAGCEVIIVHAEACPHLHRTLSHIAELGVGAGVAVNPATSLESVRHVLDVIDLLLIMTVNPGFGGQTYLSTMEPKIELAARLLAGSGVELEVDGGIGPGSVTGAVRSGAQALVAGSALYRHPDGLAHAVAELRNLAEQSRDCDQVPRHVTQTRGGLTAPW